MYQNALVILREKLPENRTRIANSLVGLGQTLVLQSRAKEAEPLLREALEIRLTMLGDADWRTAEAKSLLGLCLAALEQYEDAESLLSQSYATLKEVRGEDHTITKQTLDRLINLHESWGRTDEAEAYRKLRLY